VCEILQRYHGYVPVNADPGVDRQIVIDSERDHYQLLSVGWEGEHRVYGCSLHIDIKESKVWIQRDFIDVEGGVAGELVEMGVAKEDIVLAFHAPYKRPYTGFAVV
jgi:hypothetical protein